jgi:hypothetical protein
MANIGEPMRRRYGIPLDHPIPPTTVSLQSLEILVVLLEIDAPRIRGTLILP